MWYTWNLEKALAPHSSTLAWKIPWTEEPGRLQSMGSQRVGHDWVTLLSLSCTGEGNGNPLQCSCLENPRDERGWWATVYGVAQSRTQLKRLSSSSSIPEINTLLSVNFTSINKTKSKIQTPPQKKTFCTSLGHSKHPKHGRSSNSNDSDVSINIDTYVSQNSILILIYFTLDC